MQGPDSLLLDCMMDNVPYEGTKREMQYYAGSYSQGSSSAVPDRAYLRGVPYKTACQMPAPILNLRGRTLSEGIDYNQKYSLDFDELKGSLILTGLGEFKGQTVTKDFDILPLDLRDCDVSVGRQVYSGSALTPKPEVTLAVGNRRFKEGADYSLSYSNNTKAGEGATVTITAKGECMGSKTVSFPIEQATLTSDNVVAPESCTYNRKRQLMPPTVMFNGKKLVEGTDYTLRYMNADLNKRNRTWMGDNVYGDLTTPDDVIVQVFGYGNFKGTVETGYTIKPKDIADSSVRALECKEFYTGAPVTPRLGLYDYDLDMYLNDNYFSIVSLSNNVDVGKEAKAVIAGKGNYTGTRVVTFEIYGGGSSATSASEQTGGGTARGNDDATDTRGSSGTGSGSSGASSATGGGGNSGGNAGGGSAVPGAPAGDAAALLAAASYVSAPTFTAAQAKAASDLGATSITLGPKVKKIAKGALAGTGIKTLVVKSKKLTKKGVKGALKGSKVKTVKVQVKELKPAKGLKGKALKAAKKANKKAKTTNKKYAKKYKKVFVKKVCGKKVKVKA